MKFLKDKQTRHDFVTYAMCIVAFAIVFFMQSNHMIPRMIAGQLVPITAYIVMAISLNLVVGIAGDAFAGPCGLYECRRLYGYRHRRCPRERRSLRSGASYHQHRGRRCRCCRLGLP